ncbi:hypothetical protein LV84_01700 [Algoriphagus ratkowskyi]|uniref:Uncharacterized protein n=1 Tax=Algoriphagus ratkowskyi TaxID=57028 RepID=A0A2W7REC5_9BACT|nr:hypothetical protein LV84_01700 [Algoriphagus ratkowskyi]
MLNTGIKANSVTRHRSSDSYRYSLLSKENIGIGRFEDNNFYSIIIFSLCTISAYFDLSAVAKQLSSKVLIGER